MSDVLLLHSAVQGKSLSPGAARLLEALPYAYRLELERRHEASRIASLGGIALLLDAVCRMRAKPPDLRDLRVLAGAKPTLRTGPSFSIAHSSTRVGVAVSETGEIGLDVEDCGAGTRMHAELERWTATEAVLKAMGRGLRDRHAVHLDPALEFGRFGETRLNLRPVTLAAASVAHLAWSEQLSVVTVEEIEWPL